jgi:putative transposase
VRQNVVECAASAAAMNCQSRTFFVTSNTHNRRAFFRHERFARLFLKTPFEYRDQNLFRLHSFVLMPDHFHMILTPSETISLEKSIQRIKGAFSFYAGKEMRSKPTIWQRSFMHHRILDWDDYRQHREYIVQNPVRARLVSSATDYPYVSLQPEFKMDDIPILTEAKAQYSLKPSTHG